MRTNALVATAEADSPAHGPDGRCPGSGQLRIGGGEVVLSRLSQSPTTISHNGTSMNPKNPSGVRSDPPITIVAQVSGAGSIPLRRAPRPVASSIAANAQQDGVLCDHDPHGISEQCFTFESGFTF